MSEKTKKILKITAASFFGVCLGLFVIFMFYVFEGLPPLDALENPKPILASKVYSSDGEIIGQYFIENRIETNLDSLPKCVVNALISAEDRKFFDHWGVDLDRFIKAAIKNILAGRLKEGASTITQQLAKNLYNLKNQQETKFEAFVRKVREWITAVQIERNFTKKEILELYLNVSFFGRNSYGIEVASLTYFNKRARYLQPHEAALLIGILKSSRNYDPIRYPERALSRRNLILKSMYTEGFLSEVEFKMYADMPLSIASEKIQMQGGPFGHFLEYLRLPMAKLAEKYNQNLYQDGLKIYSTLDSRLQNIAVKVVSEHIAKIQNFQNKNYNWRRNYALLNSLIDRAIKDSPQYKLAKNAEERKTAYTALMNDEDFVQNVKNEALRVQVGFLAVDPRTGEIKAMIGDSRIDFSYALNHITQIKRQPGSSFKPIIYAAALKNGLYPAFPLLNQPFVTAEGWSPSNNDSVVGGYTTLRDALRRSLNIVTARLIVEGHVSYSDINEMAKRCGIKTKLDLYPSIALGASVVTPFEMISAYIPFATGGTYVEPFAYYKIEDQNGMVLENNFPLRSEALDSETAFLINNMLQSVINSGTGFRIRGEFKFNHPAGGKTGTTNEFSDAWFIGFTPQLLCGVWVGFDDHRIKFAGKFGYGAQAALPIWAKFMKEVYVAYDKEYTLELFTKTENVILAEFCSESLYLGNPKLATENCPEKIKDYIRADKVPDFCSTPKEEHKHIYDPSKIGED